MAEPPKKSAGPRALAAFLEGFRTPFEGFGFLWRRRDLWRYAVLPAALNIAITLVVLGLLVLAAAAFVIHLHPRFPRGAGGVALEALAAVGLLAVALALALGAYVVLHGILCGHYHGRLAERLERELGLAPEAIRQISLRYQVADAFSDLGFLARVNAALLLLHLVPGAGTLAAAAGSLYFTALTLGSDYLDFPLALRGMRRAEKRAFLRQHRPHALGLGAAVLLLALVPVLGSFVLATAAAGAVLLHRRLTGVPEA